MHMHLYSISYFLILVSTWHGYLCSHKTKKPKFKLHNFFRQLLRIFVIDVPDSLQTTENSEQMTWQGEKNEDLSPKQWVYGVIHSVKIIEMDNFGINYYKELGPIKVVDLTTIQCVVGWICDCDHWAIIDRSRWSGSHREGHRTRPEWGCRCRWWTGPWQVCYCQLFWENCWGGGGKRCVVWSWYYLVLDGMNARWVHPVDWHVLSLNTICLITKTFHCFLICF